MAAAHSESSSVTSLSNNPPSIRIACDVTCSVLSSNERLFCSYERVPFGAGSNVATNPRAPGPFWIRSFFLLRVSRN